MTASERLKEHQQSGVLKDAWAVLYALPELIALAEAVEKSSATRPKNQLGQALAALNRKLEGGGE